MYLSDSPRISFCPSLSQAFCDELHDALGDVVVDRVGVAVRGLPVFSMCCSNAAGLPLMIAFDEELLDEGDFRLVRGELALVHGDPHVAAEDPVAVLEVQPGGLPLVGGHRHRGPCEMLHLAEQHWLLR